MRCAALALTVLCAASARAGDNDLQLWRLGHPDNVFVCTVCDGSDRTLEAGDPAAQLRFARLTASLALAFAPPFEDQAQTTGQAGFELGFSAQVAYPTLAPNEWPSAGTQGTGAAPRALFLPTVTLRKGLGGSFELGAAVSLLAGSQMLGLSGQVRWAPLEGLYSAPDLALRAWATRVVGAQDLDLAFGGADLVISKSFGLAGTLRLQPYAQYGVVLVNATSAIVDFRPGSENPRDPTADDGSFRSVVFWQNLYHRAAIGARLVSGALVLGLEGGLAMGRNGVQRDAPSGADQFTRMWTSSARLGVAF